jgi:nucleotide-binding universal stress UspA family protein
MMGEGMLPLKKIICPTDFSEPSFEGIKTAVGLAEKDSSELILVHVIAPVPKISGIGMPPVGYFPVVFGEMEQQAKEFLEKIRANQIPKHLKCLTVVICGQPALHITELAQKEKASIIIMATHGQSGWQRFISGSVTERVVRLAPCPVLAVPAPSQG